MLIPHMMPQKHQRSSSYCSQSIQIPMFGHAQAFYLASKRPLRHLGDSSFKLEPSWQRYHSFPLRSDQKACDEYGMCLSRSSDHKAAVHVEGYRSGYIENVVSTSSTTKARLLHYFPPAKDEVVDHEHTMDSWCGTASISRH